MRTLFSFLVIAYIHRTDPVYAQMLTALYGTYLILLGYLNFTRFSEEMRFAEMIENAIKTNDLKVTSIQDLTKKDEE